MINVPYAGLAIASSFTMSGSINSGAILLVNADELDRLACMVALKLADGVEDVPLPDVPPPNTNPPPPASGGIPPPGKPPPVAPLEREDEELEDELPVRVVPWAIFTPSS
jgi:hypothetical protein